MTTRITTANITDGTIVAADFGTIKNLSVDWQAVIVADGSTNTTAEAGKGYFIDTSSNTHTVTLPASPSLGDTVVISDVTGSFADNNLTVGRNGSKINGSASDVTLSASDTQRTFVYSGSDNGWIDVNADNQLPEYVAATGGTVTTSTDFKIHTFNSDGCFVVSCAGNASGSNKVDYLIVAGGGGGGGHAAGGGGGAGGYRFSDGTVSGGYSAGPTPLGAAALTVTAQTYPVVVGAGGTGAPSSPSPAPSTVGAKGTSSSFSTITSAGGGGGRYSSVPACSTAGGSGGGPDGSGNSPPVSPPQGNDGGNFPSNPGTGGGGGGAGEAGGTDSRGAGGDGLNSDITGSTTTRGGGGGGGNHSLPASPSGGPGGDGGGGNGGNYAPEPTGGGANGTANSGGGGGGAGGRGGLNPAAGGNGASGVVIIRYRFQ